MTDVATSARRPSLWHRLYHGETTFDFIGRRRIGFAISGVLLLVAVVSLFTRGLNLGIDFEGGVAWEFPAAQLVDEDARAVLNDAGVDGGSAKIQTLGSGDSERL